MALHSDSNVHVPLPQWRCSLRMNGKFGGSSCLSGTLRVRRALTYWLYVVSCVSVNCPSSRINRKSVLEAEASRGGSRRYCRDNAPVRLLITWKCLHTSSYTRLILFSDSTCPSKYVLAIQSPENNDPVLFEMFLESQQLGYSSTARQVYTRRLE